jgi:hypothetical protein
MLKLARRCGKQQATGGVTLRIAGGWSGRKDARTGKLVDGPRESWKPDLKVVKASIRFLYQTGRLSRSSDMRVE